MHEAVAWFDTNGMDSTIATCSQTSMNHVVLIALFYCHWRDPVELVDGIHDAQCCKRVSHRRRIILALN